MDIGKYKFLIFKQNVQMPLYRYMYPKLTISRIEIIYVS